MPETSVPANGKRQMIIFVGVVIVAAITGFALGMLISPSIAVIIHMNPNNLSFSVTVGMLMAAFFGSLAYYGMGVPLKPEEPFWREFKAAQKSAALGKRRENQELTKRVQENPDNASLHLELARSLRPRRVRG